MIPLFAHFSGLAAAVPHTPLAIRPTPVERAVSLGEALGIERLYIKRDDLSGAAYGGNKVRKLEFLLRNALRRSAKTVLTFGGAGSNHALATAIYAKQLGLSCISILAPQPNAHSVRRNLLMNLRVGAELHHCSGSQSAGEIVRREMFRRRMREGVFPEVIPPGGSSPMGIFGFVDAAFELRDQIEAGDLPEPDCIYAACGTMGTVIGLALGLAAAGLRSKLIAVRVTDPPYTDLDKGRKLFVTANALLRAADASFPERSFPEEAFVLRHEFKGERYGLYTAESVRAVQLVHDLAGLKIEGTYTGKAFAAIMADAATGTLSGKTVLFWNTYTGRDFSAEIAGLDYHALPEPFHMYFEQEVQPLDRGSNSDNRRQQ